MSINQPVNTKLSADAFDRPNVTNSPPTVNQPRPRTGLATRRESLITDRHHGPRVSTLLGHTVSADDKRYGDAVAS